MYKMTDIYYHNIDSRLNIHLARLTGNDLYLINNDINATICVANFRITCHVCNAQFDKAAYVQFNKLQQILIINIIQIV